MAKGAKRPTHMRSACRRNRHNAAKRSNDRRSGGTAHGIGQRMAQREAGDRNQNSHAEVAPKHGVSKARRDLWRTVEAADQSALRYYLAHFRHGETDDEDTEGRRIQSVRQRGEDHEAEHLISTETDDAPPHGTGGAPAQTSATCDFRMPCHNGLE
jgi:hypothetical protein